MRLLNLKCVVTGGASGIGAATVRRFALKVLTSVFWIAICQRQRRWPPNWGYHLAMELDVRFEAGVEQVAGRSMTAGVRLTCWSTTRIRAQQNLRWDDGRRVGQGARY